MPEHNTQVIGLNLLFVRKEQLSDHNYNKIMDERSESTRQGMVRVRWRVRHRSSCSRGPGAQPPENFGVFRASGCPQSHFSLQFHPILGNRINEFKQYHWIIFVKTARIFGHGQVTVMQFFNFHQPQFSNKLDL